MGNACKPFGYNIDDGMKAFCVSELFIGIFHLIMASVSFQFFDALNHTSGKDFFPGLAMVLHIVLMVTLILQFVMGLLMYFLGFKQRNVTVCLVWIIIAIINFSVSLIIAMCWVIECNRERGNGLKGCVGLFWSSCYLYLLYLILGVWIVIVYMKWAKSTGIAVQYSVTPTSKAAPSHSHRSTKVANTNEEEEA